MAVAESWLDCDPMATPRPLAEVATQFAVSPRTMWAWVAKYDLTKYQMPGKGKTTYLDADEVRRALRPEPKRPKP